MGLFGTWFAFMLGGACGIYAAQNYKVPDMKKLADSGCLIAKRMEQNYHKRQPDKTKIDDPPINS